jgi:hypothetical protein
MKKPKTTDLAKRARACVIGIFECCTCAFPIEKYNTATGHRLASTPKETCPAHIMIEQAQAAARSMEPPMDEITLGVLAWMSGQITFPLTGGKP